MAFSLPALPQSSDLQPQPVLSSGGGQRNSQTLSYGRHTISLPQAEGLGWVTEKVELEATFGAAAEKLLFLHTAEFCGL